MLCHKCRALIPADSPVCCNCGVIDPRPYRRFFTSKVSAAVVVALVVLGGGWTRLEPLSLFTQGRSVAAEVLGVQDASVEEIETEVIPTAAAQFAAPPESVELRWTSTWVNIREQRTVDSPVVFVLDPGVPVAVANRRGAWWEAHVDGRLVGYMSNAVLLDRPET